MTLLRVQTLAVLAGAICLTGAARAEEPEAIRDEARLFSDHAKDQARLDIQKIRATYHLDVVVQTIETQPHEHRKSRSEQARERARDAAVQGIFVDICRRPLSVQVVAWPPDKQRVFRAGDAEAVRRGLERRLRDDHWDDALLQAMTQMDTILRNNMADVPTVQTDVVLLGGMLLGLLVAWLLLLGVRRGLAAAGQAPPRLTVARWYTQLGAPGGAWLADKVFLAHHTPPLPAADALHEAPTVAPEDAAAQITSLPQELPQP
jgi:hypothetical protein